MKTQQMGEPGEYLGGNSQSKGPGAEVCLVRNDKEEASVAARIVGV